MMARRVGYALLTLGAVLVIVAIAFAYVAIWTHGPDTDRVGGTAALSACIGFPAAFLGAVLVDVES